MSDQNQTKLQENQRVIYHTSVDQIPAIVVSFEVGGWVRIKPVEGHTFYKGQTVRIISPDALTVA